MFRYALVLCALLATASAGTAMGFVEEKPEKFKNIEGCYFKETDSMIPIGEEISVPPELGCYRYLCGGDTYTIHTCGAVGADPPLKVIYDNTKSYPDCCGTIVGPDGKTIHR